jgi:hypothetical protein
MIARKVCKHCGVEKPVGEFYTCRSMADGYLSKCKRCRNDIENAKQAQKRLLRPPKPVQPVRTSKPCSKCAVEKPLADFFKDGRDLTGRTSACKLCESERKKAAYSVNPTTFLERKKAYKERNPEKVRAGNREYKRKNPGKVCAHTTVRNVRKRNAIPTWETDALAAEIQWRKDHPGMTLDHIVPITPPASASLGGRPMHRSNRSFVGPLIPLVYGLHTQANWQPLENRENARKNNRDWPHSPWSNHV